MQETGNNIKQPPFSSLFFFFNDGEQSLVWWRDSVNILHLPFSCWLWKGDFHPGVAVGNETPSGSHNQSITLRNWENATAAVPNSVFIFPRYPLTHTGPDHKFPRLTWCFQQPSPTPRGRTAGAPAKKQGDYWVSALSCFFSPSFPIPRVFL